MFGRALGSGGGLTKIHPDLAFTGTSGTRMYIYDQLISYLTTLNQMTTGEKILPGFGLQLRHLFAAQKNLYVSVFTLYFG